MKANKQILLKLKIHNYNKKLKECQNKSNNQNKIKFIYLNLIKNMLKLLINIIVIYIKIINIINPRSVSPAQGPKAEMSANKN